MRPSWRTRSPPYCHARSLLSGRAPSRHAGKHAPASSCREACPRSLFIGGRKALKRSVYVSHLSGISCRMRVVANMAVKSPAMQAATLNWIRSPESLIWAGEKVHKRPELRVGARSVGTAFAPTVSPACGKNRQTIKKRRFFVTFVTKTAVELSYDSSRTRRYCARRARAAPMDGARYRDKRSVQSAPSLMDSARFLAELGLRLRPRKPSERRGGDRIFFRWAILYSPA